MMIGSLFPGCVVGVDKVMSSPCACWGRVFESDVVLDGGLGAGRLKVATAFGRPGATGGGGNAGGRGGFLKVMF